jgi:hypothetical protein
MTPARASSRHAAKRPMAATLSASLPLDASVLSIVANLGGLDLNGLRRQWRAHLGGDLPSLMVEECARNGTRLIGLDVAEERNHRADARMPAQDLAREVVSELKPARIEIHVDESGARIDGGAPQGQGAAPAVVISRSRRRRASRGFLRARGRPALHAQQAPHMVPAVTLVVACETVREKTVRGRSAEFNGHATVVRAVAVPGLDPRLESDLTGGMTLPIARRR